MSSTVTDYFSGLVYLFSFLSTNKAYSKKTGNLTKEIRDAKPKSVTSIFVAKIIESANKTKKFQSTSV